MGQYIDMNINMTKSYSTHTHTPKCLQSCVSTACVASPIAQYTALSSSIMNHRLVQCKHLLLCIQQSVGKQICSVEQSKYYST